jgi:chorismate mutase
MQIEDWREEIDDIDRELLRLLNRRARVAQKIGALKRAAGLPICDPDREQAVLSQAQNANEGPLDEQAVAKLFRRIIRETRRAETAGSRQQAAGSQIAKQL